MCVFLYFVLFSDTEETWRDLCDEGMRLVSLRVNLVDNVK